MIKQKILIVDDEEGIRSLMSEYLENEGFEVDQAENGLIAFEKVKSWQPHLIISDIQMPVWTGIRLFENLKQLPSSGIPTLFISGYVGIQEIKFQNDVHYVGFIEKPFQLKSLVKYVKDYFSKNT